MLSGAHVLIYSTDAEADRAILRDVLKLPHVDVGRGWLIFKLPPAEVAVHPAEQGEGADKSSALKSELYLMCDDVEKTIQELATRGVECSTISEQPWGRVTQIKMPSGGELGLYQPLHPTALNL
jgi:hypothetical protein